MIKHGRLVSNIGKAGGYTTMGVSFGLGMYDDLANNNKTIGEATAHNGLDWCWGGCQCDSRISIIF